MRRLLAVLVVLAASVSTLVACGSSGGSASTAPSPRSVVSTTSMGSHSSAGAGTTQASSAMITIKNFSYQVSGPVNPGETVTVHNTDGVAHTVTADQSKSLFNVTIQPGQRATFTAPSKAGTYKFGCNFHANMHGQLTVK